MIARGQITWDSREMIAKKCKEGDADFYQEVQKILGTSRVPPFENAGESYHWPLELIVSIEEIEMLTKLGISVEIKHIRGAIALEQVIPQGKVTVHVQVPHVGLFAVNEVVLLENSCTDILQQHLEEGWHIICVCPPNAARRPDYILGRVKPED